MLEGIRTSFKVKYIKPRTAYTAASPFINFAPLNLSLSTQCPAARCSQVLGTDPSYGCCAVSMAPSDPRRRLLTPSEGKGQLVSPSDTNWQVGKGCAAGPGSQNVAHPWGPGGQAVLGVLPRLGNLGALEPLPAATAG